MMEMRSIKREDFDSLKEIHRLYYEKEFDFPDFVNHFLCAFVVEDDEYGIVSAGGIRTIPEVIALTDKNMPSKLKKQALYDILRATMYTAARHHYNEVHAFVQDEKWMNVMLKRGFKKTVGQSVVITF